MTQPTTTQKKPTITITTTPQPKQPLSKTHLLSLFQTRKIKSAKQYISQLKNSNPKAQKIIKQSLQTIFCHPQQQIPSATAYMYALVFYKNLLISGQMDYYQDQSFFNINIHQAVANICEYNIKESDIKQRGADYFKYGVKLQQPKQNEDIQVTGKAVVVFALQLLETMSQMYKQSYLTGQQSFFIKKYNELLKKGVSFPKKQDYLYIKQVDIKQFQQNYNKLLQQQEQKGGKQEIVNGQKKKEEKKQQEKQIKIVQEVRKQQQQKMNNSKKEDTKQQQKPLSIGVAAILKQVQQKQKLQQINNINNINNQQRQQSVIKSKQKQQSQKTTVRNQLSQQQKQLSAKTKQQKQFADIKAVQNNIKTIVNNNNVDQKETSRKDSHFSQNKNKTNNQNHKQTQTQLLHQANIKNKKTTPEQQQPTKNNQQPPKFVQKQSIISHKQISTSSLNKKSFKRTEINNQKKTPQKYPTNTNLQSYDSLNIQSKSKDINVLEQNHPRHKHRIFQQLKQKAPQYISTQKIQQKTQINLHQFNQNQVSDSIVSFSPNPTSMIQNTLRFSPLRTQKKSVPKTQKKQLQKTFYDNYQQLASKLNSTQKSFGNNNKKSFQKFPTKTLSAWRCQKNVRRQYEPSMSQPEILQQLWSAIKPRRIPFVPEYFYPTTLKMSALRRAALQLYQFTSNSQIFFNNNIISARLMKPSQNYFILSLANVSGKDIKIEVDHKKQTIEEVIKFVDENDKKKRLLKDGGFMDVRFVFMTNDLNFKFLTINFEIDDKILPLQLPVTLLDSCKILTTVDINEISSLTKRSAARVITSQEFLLQQNDLPKFLLLQNINKTSQMKLYYFTIKLHEKQIIINKNEQNVLFCRLHEVKGDAIRYSLQLLIDNKNGGTQNFAKVMIELLVFLLSK